MCLRPAIIRRDRFVRQRAGASRITELLVDAVMVVQALSEPCSQPCIHYRYQKLFMLLRLRREQLLARCSLRLTNLQIILLLQIFLGSSDELTLLFFIESRYFLNMYAPLSVHYCQMLFSKPSLSDLTENERVGR